MALAEKMKTIFLGHVSRKATINDLPDKIQLTVCGRRNERVTVRLLDSTHKPLRFFDEGYVTELDFTIPLYRESLVVDFAKPSAGEYTFEITTPAGTTLLTYLAA